MTPRAPTLRPRRFGESLADLEVDLSLAGSAGERGMLVDRLLRSSGGDLDDDTLLDLPLGDRLAALLALLGDDAPLAATVRCGACQDVLEVPLSPAALIAYHEAGGRPSRVNVQVEAHRELAFRLPTARDLARWSTSGASLDGMVRDTLLDDVPLPSPVPPAWVARIEGALAEADPLVAFRLSITCPACGNPASYPVDLQALTLQRLRARRNELLVTVHRLASAYHWTEAQIMAVPPARRRLYLSMIEDGR